MPRLLILEPSRCTNQENKLQKLKTIFESISSGSLRWLRSALSMHTWRLSMLAYLVGIPQFGGCMEKYPHNLGSVKADIGTYRNEKFAESTAASMSDGPSNNVWLRVGSTHDW